MTARVIVDVDTGVDDALALLLLAASPDVALRGVTCVAGNCSLPDVVRNTLGVLSVAGREDVPVAAGAEAPLLEPHRSAAFHGDNGLGGIRLPGSDRAVAPRHAVEQLRRMACDPDGPVTLLALGPLTNVALFLRTYPEAAAKLERIVVMGGSASIGNATPVAEFNVWHDPEAAAITFDAPVPVTMYGLDVFLRPTVPPAEYREMTLSATPSVALAGRLLAHAHMPGADGADGGGLLGDAGAACSILNPALIRSELLPVAVELAPGRSRGQTLVDRRSSPGEREQHGGVDDVPLIDVALAVDAPAMRDLFLTTIRKGQRP